MEQNVLKLLEASINDQLSSPVSLPSPKENEVNIIY